MTIYRKTAEGLEEIERRSRNLPPRLRSALILVDGKRSDDDLRKLVLAQPDETLQALLAQGLIEAVAGAPPAPVKAAPAAAPKSAPASSGSFESLRRDAVRTLTEQVGPAGESLATKMERAASAGELRPLLEIAATVIRNARGSSAAAAFAQRFLA